MIDHPRGPGPLNALQLVVRSLSALKLNPRNARTHSRRQIRQIADSIAAFGFNNPVLVDDDGLIIAGHGRVAAAKLLGMTEVPTVCLSHMSEAEKRAYVIADNRLAEKAGWDHEILAIEFQTLFEIAPELDLTVTGFEIAEIDLLIEEHEPSPEPDALDEVELPETNAVAVTRPGDLWLLGPHRVLCGRCDGGRVLHSPARGRGGADGLHRSALQRGDRRQRHRPRPRPATASSPWPRAR